MSIVHNVHNVWIPPPRIEVGLGVTLCGMRIEMERVGFDACQNSVRVEAFVAERDTGRKIPVLFNLMLPRWPINGGEARFFVKQALMKLLEHELDELLLLYGQRDDPHLR